MEVGMPRPRLCLQRRQGRASRPPRSAQAGTSWKPMLVLSRGGGASRRSRFNSFLSRRRRRRRQRRTLRRRSSFGRPRNACPPPGPKWQRPSCRRRRRLHGLNGCSRVLLGRARRRRCRKFAPTGSCRGRWRAAHVVAEADERGRGRRLRRVPRRARRCWRSDSGHVPPSLFAMIRLVGGARGRCPRHFGARVDVPRRRPHQASGRRHPGP